MTDREAMNLPPMPPYLYGRECSENERVLALEVARDYGAACYAAGMDAAAKVCEEARDTGATEYWGMAMEHAADAIRAAMPPKP